MDFAELLKDVGKGFFAVAPTVAKLLPFPGAPLAGMAIGALGDALLGDSAAPAAKVAAKVQDMMMTPEGVARLREIDAALATRLKELDIRVDEIHAGDRDSARKREAAVKDRMPAILAVMLVGGFLAACVGVLAGWVEGVKDPIMAATVGSVIGYLANEAKQVTTYYFGSSSGSDKKNDLIGKLTTGGR